MTNVLPITRHGVRILTGDCREVLKTLPDDSVHCVVTSPPYFGLRDYGVAGQIGLEETPDAYVAELVAVFQEVRRVLVSSGTLWLNLGDSYTASSPGQKSSRVTDAGSKQSTNKGSDIGAPHRNGTFGLQPKNLVGIPWRVAFALQADGWWLRQDIIWSKPNPMPESVTDRCTKAHEYLFMLTKSARYYFNSEAIRETCSTNSHGSPNINPGEKNIVRGDGGSLGKWTEADKVGGRNKRSVWEISTQPFPEAHFATFPPALIEPCILAGCPKGGTVLDPFFGAGTTGLVADRLGRSCIGIELNPEYAVMAECRLKTDAGLFAQVDAEPAEALL